MTSGARSTRRSSGSGATPRGSIDEDDGLVCPWHGSKYDVNTGRMVLGPQGIVATIPGLGMSFKALTRMIPLKRGMIEQRSADLYID
jgi:nitrite reductase/ring-hydroxylating ferredoxin subunit